MDPKQKKILIKFTCQVGPSELKNSIQIHAEAAKNAGCGIIYVPEIKTGKNMYTDHEGSYGPLLAFYDDHVPGTTLVEST